MIGELSSPEIESLLRSQLIGRIGCHDGDEVYIVPISYAYAAGCIYCHTSEGKKIDIMRKNPNLCFQLDEVLDITNWKSVIAWGEFKEIDDQKERNETVQILLHSHLNAISTIKTHLGDAWPFSSKKDDDLTKVTGIFFKICLTKKTGKFERSEGLSLSFN